MQKGLTYEEAINRLEEIAHQMEENEIGIDEMAKHLKEAQELLAFCKKRLYAVDEDIQKIMENT